MIFDNIKNAQTYFSLDENIKIGLKFILDNDLSKFKTGETVIVPDKIKANIQEYQTKESGDFEAHRKYIDIQYVIEGSEKMGVSEIENLSELTKYDEEKDVQFFDGTGDFVTVSQGYFTIFFPQDAHKPCIMNKISKTVKKVVIKILI